MIQVQDLRIGNFIQSGKGIYKVISISHHEGETDIITVANDGLVIPYPCIYKPIPITEEWLFKFGFEQRDHLWSIDIDRYNKINYNSDQKLLFSGQLGFSIQHDIKYIHQLQNLYFALTQKELTLNE